MATLCHKQNNHNDCKKTLHIYEGLGIDLHQKVHIIQTKSLNGKVSDNLTIKPHFYGNHVITRSRDLGLTPTLIVHTLDKVLYDDYLGLVA